MKENVLINLNLSPYVEKENHVTDAICFFSVAMTEENLNAIPSLSYHGNIARFLIMKKAMFFLHPQKVAVTENCKL